MKRTWLEHSLDLSDTARGVLVRQDGDAYVAKDWVLSESVMKVVETALRYGLACMIQNRHPQPSKREPMGDGAIYLSFARRSTEYWVLGLNDNAGLNRHSRSSVQRVLFNKNYRHALIQADIPFQVEKFRNASNIEVPFQHLEDAVKACLPYLDTHAHQRGKSGVEGDYPGFRDEADIERWLMEHTDDKTFGRALSIVGRQVRTEVGIIDILARDNESDNFVVIEVKQGRAQPVHVEEQLTRYLSSEYMAQLSKGKPTVGVLVAELMEASTCEAIKNSSKPILGFTVEWRTDRRVLVKRVAGSWPR